MSEFLFDSQFFDDAALKRTVASSFSLAIRLVLGSRSPRRRGLLNDAGYRFEILPPDDEVEEREKIAPGDPARFVDRLAFVKARNVVEKLRSGVQPEKSEGGEEGGTEFSSFLPRRRPTVVVACDSVAVCGGEILEKPTDRADAERMLRLLSGSVHSVWTGLCLWAISEGDSSDGDFILRRVERSRLEMEALSEDRLAAYLESGRWEGKAGAFGYQDGDDWLRLVSGSESNVVGLPTEAFAEALREVAEAILGKDFDK